MKKLLSVSLIVLLLAVVIAPCVFVRAEGELAALVDKGAALLFDTSNVTISGKAEFHFDGTRFKTAEIKYVQDRYNSFWQEKLLTPRENQPDRETGFTVIANYEKVYIIEPYIPGSYSESLTNAQITIMHDSLEARLLKTCLKAAADLVETEKPQSVFIKDNEILLKLTEDQVSSIENGVLMMAGRFIAKRLFGIDYDKTVIDRSEWDLTETSKVIFMTESCEIRNASALFSLDTEGRLAGVSGDLSANLIFLNQERHQLDISFDLVIGEYGSSEVKLFDPNDYQVVPMVQALAQKRRAEDKQIEPLIERAYEMWKAAGYSDADSFAFYNWSIINGVYHMTFRAPGDDSKWGNRIEITDKGNVLVMTRTPWQRYDSKTKKVMSLKSAVIDTDDVMKQIVLFLKQANPEVDPSSLKPVSLERFGDVLLLDLHGDYDEEGFSDLQVTVQLYPEFKIEHYTCIGNG